MSGIGCNSVCLCFDFGTICSSAVSAVKTYRKIAAVYFVAESMAEQPYFFAVLKAAAWVSDLAFAKVAWMVFVKAVLMDG